MHIYLRTQFSHYRPTEGGRETSMTYVQYYSLGIKVLLKTDSQLAIKIVTFKI